MTMPWNRWLKPPLVATMALLGLLALSPFARTCWQSAAITYWTWQIDSLEAHDAKNLLRQFAEQPERFPVVVHALSSNKVQVTAAARETLLAEIDSWHSGRTDAHDRATAVVRALRDSMGGETHFHSLAARDLALAILDWQQASGSTDIGVTEECHELLASSRQQHRDPHVVSASSQSFASNHAGSSGIELPPTPRWQDAAELAQIQTSESGVGNQRLDTDQTANSPIDDLSLSTVEPERLQVPEVIRSLTSGSTGSLQVSEWADRRHHEVALHGNRVIRLASEFDREQDDDPLLAVIRRMQDSHEDDADKLTEQFAEFDLDEVELALVGELLNPLAARRRELAETLPSLRSVDNRRWLKLLAHDEDAGVRLTALSLLATTGDPALIAFAKSQASRDPDDRIRNQLGRQLGADFQR